MSNVLSDTKKQQVLALGRLHWSLRRIERETGVRRETASQYLKAAGIPVRAPRHWGKPPKPANEVIIGPQAEASACPVYPEPVDEPRPCKSLCESYRPLIEDAVSRGRNAKSIWQTLVTDYGFTGRYSAVIRFVRKLGKNSRPEARVLIQTEPGVEAQVDYGEGPLVRDPKTGQYRKTRLFIMTLGFSRHAVRLLTWKSSCEIWAQLHERAFRRFGGVPRVVVLDNLREGVIKPDVYDPELNHIYRDMLKHYGAQGIACRVRNPDRKGKVESSIGHAQSTALKGQSFETLEVAQAYLDSWSERWADNRVHGTTKRCVDEMFA